jgi:hypothetical protein
LSGVRSEVFNQLLSVVDSEVDELRAPDLIDVVKPLCEFAAGLPDFSRNTTSLRKNSLAIRDALLNAREPSTLLFEQLPSACCLPPVPVRQKSASEDIKKYVRELKKGLGELRSAYPTLLGRIEKTIAHAFELGDQYDKLRTKLERRSLDLGIHITEPTLKAFSLRLADSNLPRDSWLESIGSLVLAKPPRRWHDSDIVRFEDSLAELVSRFEKTSSLAFTKSVGCENSFRLSILQRSGEETSKVVQFDSNDLKKIQRIELHLEKLLNGADDLAIAAVSHVLLRMINREGLK